MMLNGLGAFKLYVPAGGVLDERFEVAVRIRIRIRMDDAHSYSHASIAPWQHPGVAGRSDLISDDEKRFVVVVAGRKEVILSSHAKARKTGIGGCLFEQQGTVSCGIDHQARADHPFPTCAIFCTYTADNTVLQDGAEGGGSESNVCASVCGALREELEDSADIHDAQLWNRVLENRRLLWCDETAGANRMIEMFRDAESLHFGDEAAAARTRRHADLTGLL